MLSDIIQLYFLGLLTLLFSSFLGMGLFRFRTVSIYLGVLIGYLFIVASYAVFKSNGNSMGFFVIIWILGFIFLIQKKTERILITRQEYLRHIVVIGILWSVIFLLKASCFWNTEYNCPNLLFVDYEYYMKIAEGYNVSGNENALGLRNALFPFLDFAQPYRTNDFWLMSIGLDLTKIDTIFIWELYYSTILICICSLSLYVVLKEKFNILWSLVLSVLFLFAFTGTWYRSIINWLFSYYSASYDPIGIISYTKLAIVFSILFQFFFKYKEGKKIEAVYYLILIPLLVQSTIAIFLQIFIIIFIWLFQERKSFVFADKKYTPLIGVLVFIFTVFFLFYYINQGKEQTIIGYSNLNIVNNDTIIEFILQFFKKSVIMFISYYWLNFLLATLLLIYTKSLCKTLRFELFVSLLLCYFCSILMYAKFNKIGDAYQFSTNIFGPYSIALIIYLILQTPVVVFFGKLKITFLIFISILGAREIIGGNNVFHSTSRINYYDKEFIKKIKNVLPLLKYPYGILYYGDDLQKYPREDFPQYNTTFLKLFGRNYDAFNIEADSLKMDNKDKSNQKVNLYIKKNALVIWQFNKGGISMNNNKLSREDFYYFYPFSFCVSLKSKEFLPSYLQSDIEQIIWDKKSKIYFYKLKRNPKMRK